jgi:hypothetical protein
MQPKVFISYSWSSPGHQALIRQWAEQLVSDGVDVVLDIWDLKEGFDKYAFMETMVTDESVTHVLVFSDSTYAKKADDRKAGVGTESQIISREVYSKVQQSKFLPVVCEFDESGDPYLPVFLKSRIWIDFSTSAAANENWERLIRLLYGRPEFQKPTLGQAPTYVTTNVSTPANPTGVKFSALKQAIVQEKRGLKVYRQDFLDACCSYADTLRVRERPDVENLGLRVLEDCRKLKVIRDHITDWVLLEAEHNASEEFGDSLVTLLERLLELKSRPPEINSWNEVWFEAHRVFVYETFLYIVAALVKCEAFVSLKLVFAHHYILPETEVSGSTRFGRFDAFYGHSETLQILAPNGQRLNSAAAELISRQADRADVPFEDVLQAELLVLMMAFVTKGCRWYPQTLHYASRGRAYPFFAKAARRRDFVKLATISGIETGEMLRAAVKSGHSNHQVSQWTTFWSRDRSFSDCMNLDALDTLG